MIQNLSTLFYQLPQATFPTKEKNTTAKLKFDLTFDRPI